MKMLKTLPKTSASNNATRDLEGPHATINIA